MALISPPNKMRQMALMLSGSFFFTVGAITYVLFNTLKNREQISLSQASSHPLVLPLAGAAIAAAIASFVIAKIISPKALTLNEELKEQALGVSQEQKARDQKRFQAHIVAMSLSEAPAVFGFIVGTVTGSFEILIPFVAASVFLMAAHMTRLSSWK